jgi:hypothetical protein
LFRGDVISVLGENLVDTSMHIPSGKELWDALEEKFGVSDAGSELYVTEHFYDYRMVDDCPAVEKLKSYRRSPRSLTTSSAIWLINLWLVGLLPTASFLGELCYFYKAQEIGVHCSQSYRHS